MNHIKPIHLYRQIAQDIRTRISEGELPVGTRLDSHKELASNFNVSLITIKKALYELIHDGLLVSKAGKGTFVINSKPKSKIHPENRSNNTIGFVLRDFQNPFFSIIAHEVELLAHKRGYTILFANSSDDFEKEENLIRQLRQNGAIGLIIASMSQKYFANETIRTLHEERFPYVMVSYTHDPDIYFVGTDHIYGGLLATEHLIKQGYKSIGYINSQTGNLVSDLRRIGYFKALEQHSLPVKPEHIYYLSSGGGWKYFSAGYEIGKSICRSKNIPDGFFIYNDPVAIGFLRAVLESGMKVPDDIAIVGFDDIELASLAQVPLTTIRQPVHEIVNKALDVIIDQINEGNPNIQTIFKPELIVRNSTIKKTKQESIVARSISS